MRRLPSRLTHRTGDRAPTPLVLAKDTFQRENLAWSSRAVSPVRWAAGRAAGQCEAPRQRRQTVALLSASSYAIGPGGTGACTCRSPSSRASVWALVQSQGGKQRWRWARWGAGYKWVCLIRREHRWSVTCIYATLNLPAFGAVLFLFTCK